MTKLKQSFLIIVIGLALAAGLSYAWTGPTATPPNNNASAPINVSGNEQEFVDNKKLKVKGGGGVLDLWGALKVNGIFQLVDGTQGAGRVLTSDKDGKASWEEPGGVSGEIVPFTRTAVFDSSTSWTVPAGVNKVIIEAWGGGGGGGGGGVDWGGNGGGGGGYGKGVYAVTAGSSLAITVGIGGAGGGAYSNGKKGNNTTVLGTGISIIAGGGSGGDTNGGANGFGGKVTGAIFVVRGGVGCHSDSLPSTAYNYSNGGCGGDAGGGGGAGGPNTEITAIGGEIPGGGGGGGASRADSYGKSPGANGANGRVVIWY